MYNTDWFSDVWCFHTACNIPVRLDPGFPSDERVALRVDLINEEVNKELLRAIESRDLVKTADGIADAIYVLIGAALEFGIPLDRVWAAVHESNMAMMDPATGYVKRREDGKVLKPDGWKAPDIAGILRQHN